MLMRRALAVAAVLASLLAAARLTGPAAASGAAARPARKATTVAIQVRPDPSRTGGRVVITGHAPGARRAVLWQRLVHARRFRPVVRVAVHHGSYTITRAPATSRWWFVSLRGPGRRGAGRTGAGRTGAGRTGAGRTGPRHSGSRRTGIVHQRVHAAVTLRATAVAATATSPAGTMLSGSVAPSHRGELVTLERRLDRGWWVVGYAQLDRTSDFRAPYPFTGVADLRAVLPGDRRNARSASPILLINAQQGGPTSPAPPTPPAPPSAKPTVGAALGAGRALPPNFFGFNWSEGAALFPSDLSGQYSALAALHPGTLRWPGGTGANYFQWRTPVIGNTGFRFTLQDLEAAYRATAAPPLFNLNLLTSTLPIQVKMLQTARSLGLPIRYIELGNELSFNVPGYIKAFKDGAAYGRVVGHWVATLHRDFPGVQVAAVGGGGSTNNSRQQTWNAEMLAAARAAGGLPDAITLHIKPSLNTPLTTASLPVLFAGPYRVVAAAGADVAALPTPRPAWMTEYNLAPGGPSNPVGKVYAQAPFVAEYALLLQRVPSLTLIDYWTAINATPSSAYTRSLTGTPALTPAGLGLEWVGDAAAGASVSTPISFTRGPVLSRGRPELIGTQFAGASGTRDLIVNLSPDQEVAPAGAAIPAGDTYTQVTGGALQPVAYASQLQTAAGTVTGSLTLPPYSVTLVGG